MGITNTGLKVALVFMVFQNIFMQGASVVHMVDLIRSLQMILHLPMMGWIVPGNLAMMN